MPRPVKCPSGRSGFRTTELAPSAAGLAACKASEAAGQDSAFSLPAFAAHWASDEVHGRLASGCSCPAELREPLRSRSASPLRRRDQNQNRRVAKTALLEG